MLDLQVGGQAVDDDIGGHLFDDQTLPAIKLERLAVELNTLEKELQELEKDDIPGGYSDDNDAVKHIQEIEYLRSEMDKILGSDAFESLEGKNKIENLLQGGTQIGIQKAMNEMIEKKITEYHAEEQKADPNAPASIQVGDAIKLMFEHSSKIDMKNHKLESEIMAKFQQVDLNLNQCERIIGIWKPENKFACIYSQLDDMCDTIEALTQDTTQMNYIGLRAKDLNKDLDDIVRRLQIMNDVNYDKNKIDYLFNILERSLESGD